MATKLPTSMSDINAWQLMLNDAFRPLMRNENLIIELNGNNPPTIKAGTAFYVHDTDLYTIPLTPVTENNVYVQNATMEYLISGVVFEQDDVENAWSTGLFGALSNSKTYYLYCVGTLDTAASDQGKGSYGASYSNIPAYDEVKQGFYSSDGKVIASFDTDGSGNVDNLIIFKSNDLRDVGSTIFKESTNRPAGALEKDGSAVSRSVFSRLFADIGILHGAGDGSTTFNLPNSKTRSPRAATIIKQTFATTDVNTGTERITLTGHGVTRNGSPGKIYSSGAVPAGITAGTQYYLRVIDANTIELYDTEAHAINTGATTGRVNITDQGSGTHYATQIGCTLPTALWGHHHVFAINGNYPDNNKNTPAGTGTTTLGYSGAGWDVLDPEADNHVNGTPTTTNESRPNQIMVAEYILF